MSPQHHKTTVSDLLDDNGHIIEPGYATELLWKYDRNKIHGGWHRIKEWDYYYVLDAKQKFGITFTISDLGYMGLVAVCWLDFTTGESYQTDTMTFFPKGKTGFPPNSSEGTIQFQNKTLDVTFEYDLPSRTLRASVPKFKIGGEIHPLSCNLTLHQDPDQDSMTIATSWEEDRTAFYYNQKINCMPVSGQIKIGSQTFECNPETTMAGLDWGRGKWTYKNRWFWGSASGLLDGKPFGWNLGYGFSDRSPASENMLFYEGKAHKLEDVTFHFNPQNYLEPWKITSSDGRCELSFQPAIDRSGKTNFLVLKSIQHQVFGYFSGTVILDDGTELHIKDFLGFAEDVLNWW